MLRAWRKVVSVGGTGHDVPFGVRLRRAQRTPDSRRRSWPRGAGLSARAIAGLERGERRRPYPGTPFASLADALSWRTTSGPPTRGGTGRDCATRAHSRTPGVHSSDTLDAASGPGGRASEVTGFLEEVRLLTLTGTAVARRAGLGVGPVFACRGALSRWRRLRRPGPARRSDACGSQHSPVAGREETEGQSPGQVLACSSARQALLLVLDNFEHVLQRRPRSRTW
jgi:hypothetical protein